MFLRLALAFLLLAVQPLRAEIVRFPDQGFERKFELYLPDGLTGPAPLVLVLHGFLASSKAMRKNTRNQFEHLADQFGFIVAYPEAIAKVWNLGEGRGAAAMPFRRDDLGYLLRVIDAVDARAPVDRTRVYGVGFSLGGMMAYALACKHPGTLRAIAAFSMPLPDLLADDCAAHPPDGVLVMQGENDRVVPFDGRPVISGPNAAPLGLLSHDDTMDFFARYMGCTGIGPTLTYDRKDDGTRVRRTDWAGCRGALEGWVVEGAGHSWPNAAGMLAVVENTTREVDGATLAWSFFSRFK